MTSKEIRKLAGSFLGYSVPFKEGDKVTQNGGKQGEIVKARLKDGKQVYDVRWDGQTDTVERTHGQLKLKNASFTVNAQAAIEVSSIVDTLKGLASDTKIVSPAISKQITDLVNALKGAKPDQTIQLSH
jgi:hypothetical protein